MKEKLSKKEGSLQGGSLPTIEKEVQFTLTEHEVADLGRRNAEIEEDLVGLEADFQKLKDEHRGKCQVLESERLENNRRIRAGGYLRMVTVEVDMDYQSATVRYLFEGQCVEERAMTPGEHQMDWLKAPHLSEGARA